MRVLLALMALSAVAHAQQMPCEPCARGADTLSQWKEAGVRLQESLRELVSINIRSTEITEAQHAQLDQRAGQLSEILHEQLVALSPEQRTDVAAALCNAPDGECVTIMVATFVCMVGGCRVLPQIREEMERGYDPPSPVCDPTVDHVRSPARGIGFEWATGWQDDASPVDHRAWSVGFEARARVHERFGLVGRLDRSTGRDKATDANRDGIDDVSTGAVTRVTALAGPSVMFGIQHDKDIARYLQLDLLGGYQWTLSQNKEDGLLAGADLSYSLAVARLGVRVTQGFGDAQESRAVIAHAGFVLGGGPAFAYGAGCGEETRSPTKIALALDLPLFGYGMSKSLDYVLPGFGVEALYHATSFFDGFVHGDIIDIPNVGDHDRAIYQTLLAGGRIDLASRPGDHDTRTGIFATLGAGYAWAATTVPTTLGSGPVAEAALGWGGQGDDGAAYLKVHARFGLTPDNEDFRALFLSGGVELRLDRSKWKDRN